MRRPSSVVAAAAVLGAALAACGARTGVEVEEGDGAGGAGSGGGPAGGNTSERCVAHSLDLAGAGALYLRVDGETALRRANAKFERRFRAIEAALRAAGRDLEQASLDEMEELWQAAKRSE